MKKFAAPKRLLAVLLAFTVLLSAAALGLSVVSAQSGSAEPVVFAKLDGSEWPIVHPGLNSDYHAMNLDRKLNFTQVDVESPNPTTTVYSSVNVSRSAKGLAAADLSGCDVFTFNLTVEDNGAWPYYQHYIKVTLNTASGRVEIPAEDVLKGFSNVVPGKTVKVKIPLDGVDGSALKAVNEFIISVEGSTCDKNLCIKANTMQGEVLPEDIMLLDDEAEEKRYPLNQIETENVKVGKKALGANTLNGEGWISYAGFWGGKAIGPLDLSEITSNGTDGAVRFWFYIDDETAFNDLKTRQAEGNYNRLKLGDCKSPDGKYYTWLHWFDQVTELGWNEIVLPFADAGIESSAPDLTAIDTLYFKLSNGAASVKVLVDDFKVSASTWTDVPEAPDPDEGEGGSEGDPVPEDGIVIVDDEAGEGWYPAYNSTGEQVKIGTHSLKAKTISPDGLILYAGYWGAKDLPAKNIKALTENGKSGALTFWIYIEDIADMEDIWALEPTKPSVVKIGDCNAPDGTYLKWSNWTTQITESGWNQVVLKINEAQLEAGGPDLTALDTFVIKFPTGTASRTVYLDDIRVVATEEEYIPQTVQIAALNGTEWPIVHPGLKGAISGSADYDVMNFDRWFSGIPSGDINTYAYVTRNAKGWKPVDATEHNILTFDMVVEDNGSWDTYKDGMVLKLRTLDNGEIAFSSGAVAKALKNVVPGEKCRVVVSLASIGRKNLSQVDGINLSIGDTISSKQVHITITNLCVEYSSDSPAVSDEPVLDDEDDEEEEISVLFAKLDGTEWPIVHPGLNSDYHAKNFDRYINFTERNTSPVTENTVYSRVNVIRTEKYKDDPSDFTQCNILTFNVLIEDNGAWNDYKDKLSMSLTSTDDVAHPISSADVQNAFSGVVPGEWCVIKLSLASLHKGELDNIKTVGLSLKSGSSDKDLHIRMLRIEGKYDKSFADVPEAPSNNDPTLILNDEYGEKAWPASITSDISKVGNKCYSATTFVTTAGYNEGWLIRMGFWGENLNRALDISKLTAGGTKAAIRFWVYAEDAELVRTQANYGSGSYCRYGSSDSWDGDAFQWRGWANQIIYDGWNEIVLPFAEASKNGNPDLTNMYSFALKFGEGKVEDIPRTHIYIDDIRISQNTKSALPISFEPTVSGGKIFNPFEDTYGLNAESTMTYFGLDLKEKTQGMASFKWSVDNGSFVWLYRAGESRKVDATGYNALEFDLWVDTPEFFEYAGGALEITSSGIWDQNEMSWGLSSFDLKEGWNHIKLSFDYASYSLDWKGNPDVDLTALNFMRIYTTGSENYQGKNVTFRIDNMCFTKNGEEKVEKSVITTNDTGYELYLTAKPDVIPEYGEIVVEKPELTTLPKAVRTYFEGEKNTVVLSPTYYKDSIEYLFDDTVTVHLSQDKLKSFENKYLYRLDVNGSFRKLSRIDNKSKNELIWDEPSRLATYIVSDVLIEDEVLADIEKQLGADESSGSNLAVIIGVSAAALVVLVIGAATGFIIIKKRKSKGAVNN